MSLLKPRSSFASALKKKLAWSRSGPYIVAFLVPILVMIIVSIERGIFPFGNKCFLRTDLYHQYAPFFKELRTKLTGGGSLFYSWNIGGGTNFWALSAYYLASPTNLFLLICPEGLVIEYVTVTIYTKLAFCAVTMTYYLNHKHAKHGIDGYAGAFFGIFYALSGYMAAYNWNVMWLDCLFLFPIVILGVERLALENKGLLYGVSLGLAIFTNYYIAVMICGGVILYCLFLVAVDRRFYPKFWLKFLKFVFYTGLALMLSAVFLLPYVYYFGMTASAGGSFKWEWYSYFSVFKMIARHLINVEVHTGLEHWPNIYSGMAVFLLIPLYYLNRKVTLREKIGYTVLLVFFYFSFSTRAMDYIWHVFHIPNSLPCRQSFIYVFLLLTMAYRGLMGLKERSYRDITFAMIASLLFIFAVQELNPDEKVYTPYVIFISAVFVVLYTILLYVKRRDRLYRDIVIVLFITLAAVDVCVDTSVTSVPTVTRSDYTSFDQGVGEAMKIIRNEEGPDSFYRVEKTNIRTKNDGAWLNYPSISTFSSCANARLTDFYKYLGMESSTNAYGSVGQTYFSNMLLGVRYSIAQKKLHENEDLYSLVYTNQSNVWVYRNKYALPLGVVFEEDYMNQWMADSYAPIYSINDLVYEVSGIQNLYEDALISYTPGTEIRAVVNESGYYYAFSPKSGPKEIQVKHGSFSKKYTNLNRGYLMEVGWCEKGTEITFENKEDKSTKNVAVTLYRLREEAVGDVYDAFAKYPMEVTSFKDTEVTGTVTAPEGGGFLFTTIADEEGWEVYVDGVRTDKMKAQNAYIQVWLPGGAHTVTFKYHVPYFTAGLLLTLAAIAVFILIYVLNRRKERKTKAKIDSFIESYSGSETLSDLPKEEPAPSSDVPEPSQKDPEAPKADDTENVPTLPEQKD